MGLAASQSRLLMLTARKDDVEGQLMRIANQKLSLSRKSAAISQEYNDALNATKLVYNNGISDVDVSYGLLMNPTTSCMLVDSYGRVALDDSIASKFPSLKGTSGTGGDFASKVSAEAFVGAMENVDPETVDLSTLKSSSTTTTTTTATPFTTSYKDTDIFQYLQDKYAGTNTAPFTDMVVKEGASGDNNETPNRYYSGGAFCFYRCLDGEVKYTSTGKSGVYTPTTGAGKIVSEPNALASVITTATTDAAEAVKKALASSFGSSYSSISSQIDTAAAAATAATKNFWENTQLNQIHVGAINATDTTQITDEQRNGHHQFFIDPKQVVLTFLNYFDAACGALSSGKTSDEKTTTTFLENPNYNWPTGNTAASTKDGKGSITTAAPTAARPTMGTSLNNTNTINGVDVDSTSGTTTTTSDSSTAADTYYYNLYLQICQNGWVKDSNLSNNDYLQNQYMGGSYMIEQFKDGAWSSLSTSSPNSKFTTKAADTTKVEAKYDALKDDIDVKEKTLDLSMNDLDTERSAVTTDIDSVKKIIDKAMDSLKVLQSNA